MSFSTMAYGVIGEHLPHSFSPEIHRELASYSYTIQELTPEEVPAFLKARRFQGINVTIPYKKAVMPYLDEIDPIAEQIGAVNTIVNDNGYLIGYNTDFHGMSALLAYATISLVGEKVLVLGTGGTSVTAAAVASHLGASAVYRVSRHPSGENCISYAEATSHHTDAGVIINTTPVGMFPKLHGAPLNLSVFKSCRGVVDAVYNPLRTDLIQQATAIGIPAAGGLYMLVAQAAKAAAYFLHDQTVMDKTDAVFEKMQAQKENIVLIGMPGSGKTTIGNALQDIFQRPFLDTDLLIIERAGMSIRDIFDRYGETEFRRIEHEVIADLAPRSGCIISTGGGAVLNAENVRLLKKNGRLVWLDRPTEQLIPTDDRPLASKKADIERLYTKRLPIYQAAADERICNATVDTTVDIIKRMWHI